MNKLQKLIEQILSEALNNDKTEYREVDTSGKGITELEIYHLSVNDSYNQLPSVRKKFKHLGHNQDIKLITLKNNKDLKSAVSEIKKLLKDKLNKLAIITKVENHDKKVSNVIAAFFYDYSNEKDPEMGFRQ